MGILRAEEAKKRALKEECDLDGEPITPKKQVGLIILFLALIVANPTQKGKYGVIRKRETPKQHNDREEVKRAADKERLRVEADRMSKSRRGNKKATSATRRHTS